MKKMLLVLAVISAIAGGVIFASRDLSVHSLPGVERSEPADHSARARASISAPTNAPNEAANAGNSVRNVAARKVELEGLVLKDHLPELLIRAKSDPELAYALAKALTQCSMRKLAYENLDYAAGKTNDEAAIGRQSEHLDGIFSKCRGMDGSEAEAQFRVAGMAARANILQAQVEYGSLAGGYARSEAALAHPEIVAEYRNNVIEFTQRAAATGDPRGLMAAYGLYSNGAFVPVDKVKAYRYLSEYARLKPSDFVRSNLAKYAAGMTPAELQQATRP